MPIIPTEGTTILVGIHDPAAPADPAVELRGHKSIEVTPKERGEVENHDLKETENKKYRVSLADASRVTIETQTDLSDAGQLLFAQAFREGKDVKVWQIMQTGEKVQLIGPVKAALPTLNNPGGEDNVKHSITVICNEGPTIYDAEGTEVMTA